MQKYFDPTVLFPCAESEGETAKDKEGGEGLEAQLLLLYPLGMLSEGRGGSAYDVCMSWKRGRRKIEKSVVRVQTELSPLSITQCTINIQ